MIDYIFMDWTIYGGELSIENFISIESLLVLYSDVPIVVSIIGPLASNYYKFEALLSKHTFDKYIKMGNFTCIILVLQLYI